MLAALYPLLLWQKEPVFSAIPFRAVLANWFWVAEPLLLALFFFVSSAVIRQKFFCYACLIAASLLLALAAAETYIKVKEYRWSSDFIFFKSHDSVYVQSGQTAHLYELRYSSRDPVLGYGPSLDTKRIASRRMRGDEVIYDVLYSRDEEGRRITPDRGDKADTAVLLFGCSFTVGEGMNDGETFAWRLGERLGDKFQVFNYGFHGYGSQQMLALIESGRLDELMRRYKQIYAFYLTIPRHEKRCVGLESASRFAPRYILENSALRRAGTLDDSEYRLLAHSKVYHRIYNWVLYQHEKPTYLERLVSDALATHIAIITKSMHELTARYNAHPLTVVIWPNTPRVEPMLLDKGVHTLPLAGVMPEYAPQPIGQYELKGDGHPNALAHERIAETLADYILKDARATGGR